MSVGKRKLHVLDIQTKMEVIEDSESGLTVKQLTEKYSVGKTQVYEILKKKEDVKKDWLSGNGAIKRKLRITGNEEINRIVFDWFVSQRSKNLPLSGPILQEQARKVATMLHISDFKASNGWLRSFRRRHNIVFKEICGEAGDVNEDIINDWKMKLSNIIKDYKPEDIANADETGLFFRALPSQTLTLKNQRCSGGKLSKERLTVLVCGYMDGKMEKPVVIGKAAKPRCFKNLSINSLPVTWRSNTKAWMTAQIMEEWLKGLNSKMKAQNRHILLFLDNATCHPDVNLSNVKIAWFPPNTTSRTQPMDQGVIQTVKLYYRKFLMQSLLCNMDSAANASELVKSITVLDAVNWLADAVRQLPSSTVISCFHKAAFMPNVADLNEPNDDEELKNLQEALSQATFTGFSATEYLSIDDEIETSSPPLSLEQLIEAHKNQNIVELNSNSESEEDTIEEDPELQVTTYRCALNYLKSLEAFCLHNNDSDFWSHILNAKKLVEKRIASSKGLIQTSITDFCSNKE